MFKAIAIAVAITTLTVVAWFRGWLPVQSKSSSTQAQDQLPTTLAGGQGAGIATGPKAGEPAQPVPKAEPRSGLGLFQLGDYEAAIPRLTEDLARDKGSAAHWAALATSYEKTGQIQESLGAWNRLAANCPRAAERPAALARLFAAAEGAARVDAAMRLLREHPESTEAGANVVAIADLAEKNGRPLDAWEALSLAVQLGVGNEGALIPRCAAWADALAFSPKDVPEIATIHLVKQGDLVVTIAKKYKVDQGVVARVNRVQNGAIKVGQRLKVLTLKPTIEVSIKKLWLRLYYDGKHGKYLARQYAVCTGALDVSPTPIGTFTVSTKLINPEWTRAGHAAVPFGHPDNPLGTRWMGFAEPGYTSFGIHGTIKPETIGTHASNGCVRMKNDTVEELFDLAPSGTAILIHD
ncbi:MAG: L,D-transpeptidase family protein [Candidatus Brocadiae bacterium]|nr:L,D-transpeptidase family protein [Candidatus Brocadiia bacterium]